MVYKNCLRCHRRTAFPLKNQSEKLNSSLPISFPEVLGKVFGICNLISLSHFFQPLILLPPRSAPGNKLLEKLKGMVESVWGTNRKGKQGWNRSRFFEPKLPSERQLELLAFSTWVDCHSALVLWLMEILFFYLFLWFLACCSSIALFCVLYFICFTWNIFISISMGNVEYESLAASFHHLYSKLIEYSSVAF